MIDGRAWELSRFLGQGSPFIITRWRIGRKGGRGGRGT